MRTVSLLLASLLPVAALAQAAAETDQQKFAESPFASLTPLLVIFAIFYVLLIRPQQKRMKEHQATLTGLQKGDEVVTAGGIVGKIIKVDGDLLTVQIAPAVEVSVVKSTVTGVVGKPAAKPVVEKKKGANKNDNRVPSRDSVANDN